MLRHSPKGIYSVDTSLNYNNTFLCDPPALFHYKVNALALRKSNLALGLVTFTFLRLIVSKIITGEFGLLYSTVSFRSSLLGMSYSRGLY